MKDTFSAVKVSDHVYWVGAIDWDIRDFHGQGNIEVREDTHHISQGPTDITWIACARQGAQERIPAT